MSSSDAESRGPATGGIGVTFYGSDPASESTIGEVVEANVTKYRP